MQNPSDEKKPTDEHIEKPVEIDDDDDIDLDIKADVKIGATTWPAVVAT
jgi:hypothetical protein